MNAHVKFSAEDQRRMLDAELGGHGLQFREQHAGQRRRWARG